MWFWLFSPHEMKIQNVIDLIVNYSSMYMFDKKNHSDEESLSYIFPFQ